MTATHEIEQHRFNLVIAMMCSDHYRGATVAGDLDQPGIPLPPSGSLSSTFPLRGKGRYVAALNDPHSGEGGLTDQCSIRSRVRTNAVIQVVNS